MQTAVLHLPLDFEMREDIRRLANRMRVLSSENKLTTQEAAAPVAMATVYFVRLWSDWGRCGTDWRALKLPFAGDAHEWAKEDITFILEDFCGWKGAAGELVKLCVECGILLLHQRGDLWGLVLNDFWRYNEHLSPDFKSMQRRGGEAKAAKRRLLEVAEMAVQQRGILKAQQQLTFEDDLKVSEEEEKKVLAFIMRIDRACGVPVRSSAQYSPDLLKLALVIVRTYGNDQIVLVERYLHRNQNDPQVVKIPDRVIQDFDQYFRKAE